MPENAEAAEAKAWVMILYGIQWYSESGITPQDRPGFYDELAESREAQGLRIDYFAKDIPADNIKFIKTKVDGLVVLLNQGKEKREGISQYMMGKQTEEKKKKK